MAEKLTWRGQRGIINLGHDRELGGRGAKEPVRTRVCVRRSQFMLAKNTPLGVDILPMGGVLLLLVPPGLGATEG